MGRKMDFVIIFVVVVVLLLACLLVSLDCSFFFLILSLALGFCDY